MTLCVIREFLPRRSVVRSAFARLLLRLALKLCNTK